MLELSILLSAVTVVWLAYCALRAFRMLASGDRRSILLATIVLFLFFGLPLLFDLLIGPPDYYKFPGFQYAMNDHAVSVVYSLSMILVSLLWWQRRRIQIRSARGEARFIELGNKKTITFLLYLALLSPIFALFFAPDPLDYFRYGAVVISEFTLRQEEWFGIIMLTTVLSVIAASGLIMTKRKLTPHYIGFLTIFILFSCLINGKRGIVIGAILLLGAALWYRGLLRGKRLWAAGVCAAFLFGAYSYAYQQAFRGIGINKTSEVDLYTNLRIDYGRDSRMKMALDAELNHDSPQILEYRGQSLVFYLGMYVPREWWPDKPLPYAQYFTSAMFQREPRMWGWAMTTSLLDESVANFGLVGIVVGPLLLLFICRIGDSCKDQIVGIFTSSVAALFLCVQLVAFAPVFLPWAAMVVYRKTALRKSQLALRRTHGLARVRVVTYARREAINNGLGRL